MNPHSKGGHAAAGTQALGLPAAPAPPHPIRDPEFCRLTVHLTLALLITAICTAYPPACILAGLAFHFLATRNT